MRDRENACHVWQASTRAAARFLRDVRPYLRTKGEQVDIALAFQERRIPHGQGSNKAYEVIRQRNRVLDPVDAMCIADLKKPPALRGKGS